MRGRYRRLRGGPIRPLRATDLFPRGRRIGQAGPGPFPAEHGMVTVAWDGKTDAGGVAAPGVYFVRVAAPSIDFRTERRVVVH